MYHSTAAIPLNKFVMFLSHNHLFKVTLTKTSGVRTDVFFEEFEAKGEDFTFLGEAKGGGRQRYLLAINSVCAKLLDPEA